MEVPINLKTVRRGPVSPHSSPNHNGSGLFSFAMSIEGENESQD